METAAPDGSVTVTVRLYVLGADAVPVSTPALDNRNPAGKVLKSVLRGDDSAFATADDQAL